MGKKKQDLKKRNKALLKELPITNCKIKCCKKFKKGENKRCKRCPCFDLLKKVA